MRTTEPKAFTISFWSVSLGKDGSELLANHQKTLDFVSEYAPPQSGPQDSVSFHQGLIVRAFSKWQTGVEGFEIFDWDDSFSCNKTVILAPACDTVRFMPDQSTAPVLTHPLEILEGTHNPWTPFPGPIS